MISSGWVNSMFVRDNFPELNTVLANHISLSKSKLNLSESLSTTVLSNRFEVIEFLYDDWDLRH